MSERAWDRVQRLMRGYLHYRNVGKPPLRDSTEGALDAFIAARRPYGFATYDDLNDAMPVDVVATEDMDVWLSRLETEGIMIADSIDAVVETIRDLWSQTIAHEPWPDDLAPLAREIGLDPDSRPRPTRGAPN